MGNVILPKKPAILLTDLNGTVYSMNEAAMALFGDQAMDFVNQPLNWALEDGSVIEFEGRRLRMDVMEGSLANYITLCDVTRQEQLEQLVEQQQQEIQALRQELENQRELSLMKERVTTMIAHEFRTPLSLIGIKSNILRKRQLPEEKGVQYLLQIENHVNELVDLLDDLAFINRTLTPQQIIQPTTLDLNLIGQSMILHMATHYPEHRIVFKASGQVDNLHLDYRLIRYVLSNLMSNALKYSSAGSEVRLDIQGTETEVIISVSDHGIGIPPDELSEILTPFYRASNAAHFSGSGLGLAIVKASVESCGGNLHIESTLGEGTTITVSLPRQDR